uniref:Secreted protein n=1 Tax=Maylandia zebra TaxID=106582 RepID=A0A3P9BTD9_9CICH
MSSMTCIMCFTWLVSHLLISSSRASSRSGPLHIFWHVGENVGLPRSTRSNHSQCPNYLHNHLHSINVSQPNSY